MNVEKTIEFILSQQAKAETHMATIERQMKALQKIVLTGMKMVNKLAEGQKEVRAELKELARAQRVTETKLQGLIDSMRRGGNGRLARN
jgi:hypothetical protein